MFLDLIFKRHILALALVLPLTIQNTSAAERIQTVANEKFDFQCKYPLSDSNDLGCSVKTKDPLSSYYKWKFKDACNKHDVCYMAPWRKAGYDGVKGKLLCDEAFKKDLYKICSKEKWYSKTSCYMTAYGISKAMKPLWTDETLGSFENRQNKAKMNRCTVNNNDKKPIIESHSITVRNGAGFMAWADIWYWKKGKWTKHYTGRFALGQARTFTLPENVDHIYVYLKGDIISWSKTIKQHYHRKPTSKCYNITGTIFKGYASECTI